MSKIGNIRVDVAASDAAYYAYAPHDSVTLPMAPDDLQKVIDKVTYFGRHDYAIEDIQTSGKFDKLHFAEDELVDLRALNAMAECVKRNPDIDYDAVCDYCDNFDVPVDPLMVGNVIMQADEMPFSGYSVDVDTANPLLSDLWRAYGLTLLDQASEELGACVNDNRLSSTSKASLLNIGELLVNVPAEALGARMAAGGDVCLGQSGYFDRNSNEVDLMKFDLDELEQAAFEGDRDFAADRIVVYVEDREAAKLGLNISQPLTLPMDAADLKGALKDIAEMERVDVSELIMCDYELHGRFSEYSWHDFGTDDPITDMNRFAQIVVDNPELSVEELFYYNDDHEIYDIDAIIESAEKMVASHGDTYGEMRLDELGESKCDEAEMVNEGIGAIDDGALESGDR